MKNPEYWSGDIPWVSPKDMKVSRLYDAIDHISAKAVVDGTRVIPAGAVLMVIRGMILVHSFPVARAERPLAFNQDMKALIVHEDFDSNFVLHWLIGHAQKLRGLSTESTHGTKRLPPETLYRVPFPTPPTKTEQESIAEALTDADALIESIEQLIAKKRFLKQAAMQELLTGKRRLPGFFGHWESGHLGEKTTKVGSGITPTGGDKSYQRQGRPFLRSQNVGWGRLLLNDIAFIDDETHATFPSTEIELGDVFLNITGASIGRSAIADPRVVGGNVNQHVCIIRVDGNKITPQFLNHILLSSIGQQQIDSFQVGGNRQGLN